MRTDLAGLRDLAAGFALAFAVAAAVFTLLNLPGSGNSLEISAWLGGGITLLASSLWLALRNAPRLAAWFGLLSAVAGLAALAGFLLAYNGLNETVAELGLQLARLTGLHMSAAFLLLTAGASATLAARLRMHGFGTEALLSASLVIFLLVPAVLASQAFGLAPLETGLLGERLLPAEAGLLLATGLLLLVAGATRPRDADFRNRFLPILSFAILIGASLHLWLVLVGEEQLAIRERTVMTAERLQTSLLERLTDRRKALERMGARMAAGELQREVWARDVRGHLRDFESLSAIGWVTPDGVVRWAFSRDDNRYHEDELYAVDAARRDVLDRARVQHRTAFSAPVELRAGGYGQIVAVPLAEENAFRGWLVVGLRFEQLFAQAAGNVAPDFAVRVEEGGRTIFARGSEATPHPLVWPAAAAVDIDELDWHITLWPEREFFRQRFLWLPGFLLTLGMLAALLFAFALYQLEAQRRRTAAVRESEARYRLTVEQTGQLVYDYHIPSGRIEWAGAIQEVTGLSPERLATEDIQGWEARLHPDDAPFVLRELERAQRALERFQCEYRFRRDDGSYLRVEDRGVFLPGPDAAAVRMLGTMADVSQRHEFENQLRHLAHYDQQTGLRNRVWFMEDAVRAMEAAADDGPPVWLVFMDVDRFKSVNETLGHVVGDLLLEAVARRLEAVVAQRGELARIGGDEFGLCVHAAGVDHGALAAFCTQLMREFAVPFNVGGHSLFVTLSVGVANFPAHGEDAQQIIRAAETAMFRAKQRGRNTFAFYEAAMSAGARENLDIANALRRALERGEFHLVFQPRYGLKTGQITGMEALLRWDSAERGSVPPAVFIPIAEETGLIGPIGWFVVDAAAVAAQRLGPGLMLGRRIAINVSARQLANADFVPELVRRVQAARASPQWFEVELTESLVMEDPQRSRELLVRLRDAGFAISIDDFGTGYSSLSYLKHFPVDHLKIDRSFVMGLPDNADDAAIVRTIIGMGRELGLNLIAEGIETQAQSSFLHTAGCQEGQGFLFARPMPLAQLSTLLD